MRLKKINHTDFGKFPISSNRTITTNTKLHLKIFSHKFPNPKMSILFESVCDLWLTKPAPIPVLRKQGKACASIVLPATPVFGGPCLISCFLVFFMVLNIIVHTLICNWVNH